MDEQERIRKPTKEGVLDGKQNVQSHRGTEGLFWELGGAWDYWNIKSRMGTPLGDVAREVAGARLFIHAFIHLSIEQQKTPGAVLISGYNSQQAAER